MRLSSTNMQARKMLFAAIPSICALSSKKISIYNEEMIVARCFIGFIIFSRKSLGNTFKVTLDGRIQAIQEESQQFPNPNEVVPPESNEQQRLLRISLRICSTVVESLPMARCAPKCEKTVQALLCRNLNVKSATLPNATSSRRIRLQDDLVTGFHFSVSERFVPGCTLKASIVELIREGLVVLRMVFVLLEEKEVEYLECQCFSQTEMDKRSFVTKDETSGKTLTSNSRTARLGTRSFQSMVQKHSDFRRNMDGIEREERVRFQRLDQLCSTKKSMQETPPSPKSRETDAEKKSLKETSGEFATLQYQWTYRSQSFIQFLSKDRSRKSRTLSVGKNSSGATFKSEGRFHLFKKEGDNETSKIRKRKLTLPSHNSNG
ncbi:hypothetical protein Patl1_14458 [Pistacia atlantica]|uniref:Uncharacterized protein n=1 Tax=Pistacia atlantica TaxID=434234 RepID=A0ACC1AW55_9ROSI|nr:hypothetical protein Patl1_14458 [Pistacia atlantica]